MPDAPTSPATTVDLEDKPMDTERELASRDTLRARRFGGEDARLPQDSETLEQARAVAARARENLQAIENLVGDFAVEDLKNSGGQ